jgi:8-oxo-dGTP pyrophosphatase MutT (NUDIX family)
MITSQTVSALVQAFDDLSDGQALKSRELVLLLLGQTSSPFSRRQFTPGHITCSGLVLAPDGNRLLLVHHRRLDRWLLPGGHVEPEDAAIEDAGRREVIEETGAVLADGTPPLIGIDVHGIPARRDQPYHLHHDLLFFFRAETDACRVSQESRAVLWCGPDEFDRYDLPGNIRRAWRRAIGDAGAS